MTSKSNALGIVVLGIICAIGAKALIDGSGDPPLDGDDMTSGPGKETGEVSQPTVLQGDSGEEDRNEVADNANESDPASQDQDVATGADVEAITQEQAHREALNRRLEAFANATTASEKVHAAQLMSGISIATILDTAGNFEELPEGETVKMNSRNETELVFQLGNRLYRFHQDEFPEYKMLRDYKEGLLVELSPEFDELMIARAEEALQLLTQ